MIWECWIHSVSVPVIRHLSTLLSSLCLTSPIKVSKKFIGFCEYGSDDADKVTEKFMKREETGKGEQRRRKPRASHESVQMEPYDSGVAARRSIKANLNKLLESFRCRKAVTGSIANMPVRFGRTSLSVQPAR
jgi:hypothetical protein